ncbi:MAG: PEP-CTERM sorting domain-containing protein [Azoarcus sp.]|nr:PEP-CTERM sorting domain-containing protein [Azoarcus sp.]
MKALIAGLGAVACVFGGGAANAASVVLYDQDFESPTGFVNDGGDVNIFRQVNQLYGDQPAGFAFAQTNTVETLLVGGSQAWAAAQGGVGGFKDPQGIAGNHVLGMLSSFQNDLLGLAFNVEDYNFLNFRLNVSSIDLDRWSGPFVPTGGVAPVFRLSLFDNPSGANGVGGGGLVLLDTYTITGLVAPNKWTFNWSEFTVALDSSGNTNGNVILQIDLLEGGYAALDNFRIAASDTPGDVGEDDSTQVPEPYSLALLGIGLAGLGVMRRRVA